MSALHQDTTVQTFRIGATARLTGVSADTLRAWERRYGVVSPRRTETGSRLYSRDDIARLSLIKRLVDLGHAIGSIAHLSLADLEHRLGTHIRHAPGWLRAGAKQGADRVGPVQVAVLGDALAARLGTAEPGPKGLEVMASSRQPEHLLAALEGRRPDVLVMELPTLHDESAHRAEEWLARSGARRGLVLYGFARREALRRLEAVGMTPLRAPLSLPELRHWCVAAGRALAGPEGQLLPLPPPGPSSAIPSRRYTDASLSRIAESSTTVRCECPQHLADLVAGLAAFETYSAECETRSPQDAALHAYLQGTTAQARALLEEALTRVIEVEGLETVARGRD